MAGAAHEWVAFRPVRGPGARPCYGPVLPPCAFQPAFPLFIPPVRRSCHRSFLTTTIAMAASPSASTAWCRCRRFSVLLALNQFLRAPHRSATRCGGDLRDAPDGNPRQLPHDPKLLRRVLGAGRRRRHPVDRPALLGRPMICSRLHRGDHRRLQPAGGAAGAARRDRDLPRRPASLPEASLSCSRAIALERHPGGGGPAARLVGTGRQRRGPP